MPPWLPGLGAAADDPVSRAPLQARQTRNAPPALLPRTPERSPAPPEEPRFAVRVLDNAVNTYQEVMSVCRAALGVSQEQAYGIAHTIDTAGSCVVCVAPGPEAQRVAGIIGTIGIAVRLEPADASAPLPS